MNDFDFLAGKWNVHNRAQDKWLVGSTNYVEFPGYHEGGVHMDGTISFDEIVFPTRGKAGVTFRVFNPETEEWSIYWVGSSTGRMDPPVVGRFAGGVGTFVGDDVYEGRPIKVRFTWDKTDPEHPRWQQELSDDDGQTWELNWIMEFSRVE
ncbi:hypothetical protein [Allorhizocola rhizosphaerae]|uniref:hypothetical protein n=1 Tax=Allorhizocola rhizosphaerae TaxID=1872709 RepID=UPI000E3BFCF0|nr:hypothetical protein [Allorhizocola rhizosphaerae]